ncbi:hypothetical protein SCP_1403850 [Sparassis crispa]|uniref:Uncharacterized protein n=1 Tax=Sparassis crispa TaxID=139825 RepID=A0A401H3H3_9APHY|nr:hypothetical protein SCP_1403850 [Sparassis crispa]GBE88977.1 hypothetical protein SCP_1403850 [Sparassis crispa]
MPYSRHPSDSRAAQRRSLQQRNGESTKTRPLRILSPPPHLPRASSTRNTGGCCANSVIELIIPSGCLCTREAHLVDRGRLRPCMTAVVALTAQPDLDADFTTVHSASSRNRQPSTPPFHPVIYPHQHLPYVQEETLAPLGASSEGMEHRVKQAQLGLRHRQHRTPTPLDARAVHLTTVGSDTRAKHRDGRRRSPHLRCTHAATPWMGRTGNAHCRASLEGAEYRVKQAQLGHRHRLRCRRAHLPY